MKSRKLRTLQVSELGFGCMNLASNYGRAVPIDDAIKVIREAHSKGVTFFDTAEVDGPAADQSSAVPKCDFIVGEVVCVVGWHPRTAEVLSDFFGPKLELFLEPRASWTWNRRRSRLEKL